MSTPATAIIVADEVQRLAARLIKINRSEPAAFEHLTEIVERGDEVAHRFAVVRLEVAAPDHAFLGVEIDQDQRPVGERCDARYDGSLELEHNWTGPNALERQQLKAHPTTSPGHACMTTA